MVAFGRSVLFCILVLCLAQAAATAQSTRRGGSPSPLHGYDFIGFYAGGNVVASAVDDGLIPAANGSFMLSSPGGAGFEFGLSFGRLMPSLFVSMSTTAEFRLLYKRLIGTSTGTGIVARPDEDGRLIDVPVRQSTTVTTTIAGGQLLFSFDTRRMAQATPTVLLGATFGHITDVQYQTEYSPANAVANNTDGVPEGGIIPARRWFYAAAHIGAGARISLGDPATSPAIVPEIEAVIPLTSLARYNTWVPFGLRAGVELRWPL